MLELRVGLPRVPWPRCCSRESPPAPPGALPGLAPPLLADSTSATRSSISSPMNVPDARGATAFLGDACYEHFPLPVPSQGEGAFYNQFSMEEALHRNLAGRMLRMNRSDVVCWIHRGGPGSRVARKPGTCAEATLRSPTQAATITGGTRWQPSAVVSGVQQW